MRSRLQVKPCAHTAAPGTKARCEEIAKAGGVAAVLGAMAAHPSSERVQSAGAEALRRMAESSDAARVALLSLIHI